MNLPLILKKEPEFSNAIEHFKQELSSLRTGRASSALVENLEVEYYGTKAPLISIAQITVPEARQITIQPYDKNALKDIEKAIQTSNVGLTPQSDGTLIRLNLPPMTEDRRKELAKLVAQMAEKTRVTIRNIREDIWKEIQRMEKDGEFSEDQKISGKEELQKVIDKWNAEIKRLADTKEQEIMTI
jgi:ribosome recycling factor